MTRKRFAHFTFATAALLVAACGTTLPSKEEAAAAVSKLDESPLTRTLPAATYCMTTTPEYSFATMGQVDFVEMFQNITDKEPLLDATKAGAVRIELKEFRFDPAGRSPDASCDAVFAQSKQGDYSGSQVRLVMVRAVLTPKGEAAGVRFDTPIEIATREVVEVTDVRSDRDGVAVTYSWRWKPTPMAEAIGYRPGPPQQTTARIRKLDLGWALDEAGLK